MPLRALLPDPGFEVSLTEGLGRSATSASSCCSRLEGLNFPATMPERPPSRNWRFQFPTDCSETFARLAASVAVTSPASTDSTIRTFSSAGTTGGLAMMIRLLQVRPANNGSCH